jgi:hypothetical protein
MQPAPTKASQNIPAPEQTRQPSSTSQHGQRHHDDLEDPLQLHSGELRGAPEPLSGGTKRDAMPSNATSSDEDTGETLGMRGTRVSTPTPPPRDRISEYENARVKTPKRPSEGPLFEVIKSNRRPDDKSSPIAKLPNGECTVSQDYPSLSTLS